MSAEEFMERTSDAEVRILASLVFSRDGKGDPSVRKAEMIRDLKALMGTEIVHFFYWKSDGTLRGAYGTRDPDLIREKEAEGSGSRHDRPLKTFAYYDIGRSDWRAFRPESIVGIDRKYTI